jgi:hypothetical protein
VQPIPTGERTDTYTLSISYDEKRAGRLDLSDGNFAIAARNADGKWVNAVSMNYGGARRFVAGPWKPEYTLGTYGIDRKTKTAWAVINYDGDFAVAKHVGKVASFTQATAVK